MITEAQTNTNHAACRVTLTAADHDQNGFVKLASWVSASKEVAMQFIADVDALVTDESEPNIKTAGYTFVLDLWTSPHTFEHSGERCLPTQVAMRLAPEQVRAWLAERPDPDAAFFRHTPLLPVLPEMRP